MDGTQFDTLIKRLSATPLTRGKALRRLAASAAILAGVTLTEELGTAADKRKKKRRRRRRPVCHCTSAAAESCSTRKLNREGRTRLLASNPCAYGGPCLGFSGCATAPVPPPPPPPLVLNRFGCVDVGQACRGDDSVCCSNRCEGAAPSPGQPDTSQCIAHDVGTCQPGAPGCPLEMSCTTDAGFVGTCLPTTGSAAYCASAQMCATCTKDSDCIPLMGATAACVAACDTRCAATGGRLCAGNLVD